MPSRSFYFIRHGQTDWNKEERLQGRTDIPLNETGRKQAREATELLKKLPIDLIVSSTLSRASETAQIINEHFEVPLYVHDDLCERGFGSSEGKLRAEILAAYDREPHLYKLSASGTPHPLDAEPSEKIKKRITAVLRHFLVTHSGNILFVSHGAVFSTLYQHLLKGQGYIRSQNAIPYHFKLNGDTWVCNPIE